MASPGVRVSPPACRRWKEDRPPVGVSTKLTLRPPVAGEGSGEGPALADDGDTKAGGIIMLLRRTAAAAIDGRRGLGSAATIEGLLGMAAGSVTAAGDEGMLGSALGVALGVAPGVTLSGAGGSGSVKATGDDDDRGDAELGGRGGGAAMLFIAASLSQARPGFRAVRFIINRRSSMVLSCTRRFARL